MATLRAATIEDLLSMQYCNVMNLPENYRMNYYFYHLLSWPQLAQVAEDDSGRIVGYVLSKMDDEGTYSHGHITSVAVVRSYRLLGVASKLMKLTHRAMDETYQSPYVSLHARVTNRAAYNMYSNVLGYTIHGVEPHYYADNEDAFNMRHFFKNDSEAMKGANERLNNGDIASNEPPVAEMERLRLEEPLQNDEKAEHGLMSNGSPDETIQVSSSTKDEKSSKKNRKKKKR